MINTIISLLNEGQEQDTALLTIQQGEAEFENGEHRKVWQATLDYYHGEEANTVNELGGTPDEAVLALLRLVELGKAHEKEFLVGDSAFQLDLDGRVDLYPLPEQE